MNFNDIDEIKQNGFIGFKKMRDLFIDSSMLPDEMGVYLVLNFNNQSGDFLAVGTGGFYKGKNPNVDISILRENWIENTKVLYIGKATSLKKRLRQYFGFGKGRNIGHYGGRFIWQLKYSNDLIVCWKTMNSDPRKHEAELIQEFISVYGLKPFANLTN